MFGLLGAALSIGAATPDIVTDTLVDTAKDKAIDLGLKTIGVNKGTKKK
jgi:hypothetical protein